MIKLIQRLIPLALVVFSIVSCTKEQETIKATKVTIRASIAGNSSSTRTSIDNDGKMFWVPGDDIAVYSGEDFQNGHVTPYIFESDIDASVASADFMGDINVTEGNIYFALYPGISTSVNSYWGDAGCFYDKIIGHLSPQQDESYDSDIDGFDFCGNAMLAAISEGSIDELYFMNVCSGLKFSLSETGFTEVSIRGNNEETVAGDFTMDFDPFDNSPVIIELSEGAGAETVARLSSQSGMRVGEWLYILILPQTFENGVTISFKKNGVAVGEIVIDSPIEFKRGIWKKAMNINTRIIEYPTVDSNGNIIFEDAVVERLCKNNWDTDGVDGISLAEAQAVTDLGTVFKGKTNIESFNELRFFTGLTAIAAQAFNGSSIREIAFPSTVTSIGKAAFKGCDDLQGNLFLPDGLTTIGSEAFSGCTSLTGGLDLRNVTSIGTDAFHGCTGFDGRLILGEGLTKISSQAFMNCGFSGSLVIPDSVTEIGDRAFCQSDNFSGTLTIGSGVTRINTFAFVCGDVYSYHCAFNTIISRGQTPATLVKNGEGRVSDVWPFSETKSGTASGSKYNYKAPNTVYVPIGCAERYETAWSWTSTARVLERSMD